MNFLDCLRHNKLDGRIFNERQLGDVLGGTDARRYGLVNRALKEQKLLRLKRGLYAVAPEFRPVPLHPFAVAQALLPGSYISFETALAFHGWTPEAVHTTASVTPERKSSTIEIGAVGRYTFSPLAVNEYQFLVGVQRKKLGDLTAFIASPLRALMDLVATRKVHWAGLGWVVDGLRIDIDELASVSQTAFADLKGVYKHKAAIEFLTALEAEIPKVRVGQDD